MIPSLPKSNQQVSFRPKQDTSLLHPLGNAMAWHSNKLSMTTTQVDSAHTALKTTAGTALGSMLVIPSLLKSNVSAL